MILVAKKLQAELQIEGELKTDMKALVLNSSIYLWYSVICSGTNREKKLGVKYPQ